MAEVEFRVEMEAWRFVHRAEEREGEYHASHWVPSCFDITYFLKTGKIDSPVPEANWKTSGWYHSLLALRKLGVKHGRESVQVMMTLRDGEAVGTRAFGGDDWEITYIPHFPGRVRLARPGEKDFFDLFHSKKIGFGALWDALGRGHSE